LFDAENARKLAPCFHCVAVDHSDLVQRPVPLEGSCHSSTLPARLGFVQIPARTAALRRCCAAAVDALRLECPPAVVWLLLFWPSVFGILHRLICHTAALRLPGRVDVGRFFAERCAASASPGRRGCGSDSEAVRVGLSGSGRSVRLWVCRSTAPMSRRCACSGASLARPSVSVFRDATGAFACATLSRRNAFRVYVPNRDRGTTPASATSFGAIMRTMSVMLGRFQRSVQLLRADRRTNSVRSIMRHCALDSGATRGWLGTSSGSQWAGALSLCRATRHRMPQHLQGSCHGRGWGHTPERRSVAKVSLAKR